VSVNFHRVLVARFISITLSSQFGFVDFSPPKSRYHSVFQAWGHVMAGRITELVLWTYGASFAKVMFFFLGFYVFNIFFWAFFIMWADTLSSNGNSCLYGDDPHNSAMARYEMAFELSWCTFTTVGYGAISPPGDDWGCYPLRLVCALIAFIGVLFGSVSVLSSPLDFN
jgi:hypothetical protein